MLIRIDSVDRAAAAGRASRVLGEQRPTAAIGLLASRRGQLRTRRARGAGEAPPPDRLRLLVAAESADAAQLDARLLAQTDRDGSFDRQVERPRRTWGQRPSGSATARTTVVSRLWSDVLAGGLSAATAGERFERLSRASCDPTQYAMQPGEAAAPTQAGSSSTAATCDHGPAISRAARGQRTGWPGTSDAQVRLPARPRARPRETRRRASAACARDDPRTSPGRQRP